MTLRKLLKLTLGLLALFVVTIGLISMKHPVILKWVTGSARHFGRSIPATVYTNGQVNDNIKVFYTDEPNNYLLSVRDYDSQGMMTFFNLNLSEKWIGKQAATTRDDYHFIGEHLFQTKSDGPFLPLQDDMKGGNFDPQFSFANGQIRFNVPPTRFKFDSVRVELD
jgi:hypothetical protein